ncbi:forkhead domain 102C [Cotesia typhae]|uniref:forkhead domain 102C n=1 Tax=Cotesia typhae TaxID=2053667 RepID=UPI003D696490
MCNNESPPPAKEPLAIGLGVGVGGAMAGFLPFEHYRLQLYHYASMAERLRLAHQLHPQHPGVGHPTSGGPGSHLGMSPGFSAPLPLYPAAAAAAAVASYPNRLALSMALLHPHHPRMPEEPKPQHSYIGLIAMAILSSPDKKLVLSDIYQHILDNYPYFRSRGPGWRNSIRHNLSLNDCFVKSGRSANGKGHYWAIHPANLEDFRRGDFRRRKAQRKVRRHMGLAVDEEPDSPSPPPLPATPPPPTGLVGPPVTSQPITALWSPHHHHHHHQTQQSNNQQLQQLSPQSPHSQHQHQRHIQNLPLLRMSYQPSRKRQFDVASLLAPDDQQIDDVESVVIRTTKTRKYSCSEDEQETDHIDQDDEDVDVDVDVVAEANPLPSPGTPSASPDTKMILPSNQCDWNEPTAIKTTQPLSSMHLHNHLHIRNYYIQANATSTSSV